MVQLLKDVGHHDGGTRGRNGSEVRKDKDQVASTMRVSRPRCCAARQACCINGRGRP